MKLSLLLLACMALGLVTGIIALPSGFSVPDGLTDALLYALMVFVGVEMGIVIRREGIRHILNALKNGAVSVVSTVTGSLLGGLLAGVVTGMGLGRATAVAAGFGWYTLSSVMLANLDGPLLGGVAFLANLFREALALLLIPVLIGKKQNAAAISSAGATSMDTTLGLLSRGGPDTAAAAFLHGVIISTIVPVLVPLLYN